MSTLPTDLLTAVLADPQQVAAWPLESWDRLIRQARTANLLARLDVMLRERSLLQSVPSAAREHLCSARVMAQAHRQAVRREVAHIVRALQPVGVDVVLLKGAAYVFAELPAANGRLFSDIDVLVPRGRLTDVENELIRHGWTMDHHEPYDQRYYREWAHELPPMRHVERDTLVDIHHAIVPPIARFKTDPSKLVGSSQAVPGSPGVRVLAPVDIVIHSAAHLFQNEDLSNGLRDLTDLDSLLRYFCNRSDFWPTLAGRAQELDLQRPLYYALRYSNRMLNTPVPSAVLSDTAAGPAAGMRHLMDALWTNALPVQHCTNPGWGGKVARGLLYVRAHWLRMPPYLLAYHLAHKAVRATMPAKEEPAAP